METESGCCCLRILNNLRDFIKSVDNKKVRILLSTFFVNTLEIKEIGFISSYTSVFSYIFCSE